MLLAAAALAALASWAPARWPSQDPKTLEHVTGSAVNCLLVEPPWSEAFAAEAAKRSIAVLGVLRPSGALDDGIRQAAAVKLNGVVLEGDHADDARANAVRLARDYKLPVVELTPRNRMRLDSAAPVIGTYQGVWAGINVEEGGGAKAAPTGAPWIDTNTGFLRFVRAASDSAIWIANTPPPRQVIPVSRYLQAVGDAAIAGTRWVIALDDLFAARLLKTEPAAIADWNQILAHVKFYEDHGEWRAMRSGGKLALVQDVSSGGLLSGGILDMMAVKHTAVRPVPVPRLSDGAMSGAAMAVNVDPAAIAPQQRETLTRFTRNGGMLLNGPPGWKFAPPAGESITVAKDDVQKLDAMWREVNSMTGRTNLGARLFNVASMLSNLLASPDGKRLVLHLVNYSGYPAEDITVHLVGKFAKAKLYAPGVEAKDLAPYAIEDGTAVEISKVASVAVLVVE